MAEKAAAAPSYEALALPRNSGQFAHLIQDLEPGDVREIEFSDEKDEQRKRNGIRSIGKTRELPLVTRKHDGKLFVVHLKQEEAVAPGNPFAAKVTKPAAAAE